MRASAAALAVLGVALIGVGAYFVGGDILFELAAGARTAGMGGAGIALPTSDALFLNPAGLPWLEGVQFISSYGDVFGVAHFGALSVGLPGVAMAGVVLDAGTIGPALAYRTTGAALGAGVRLGPLGSGVRVRVARPLAPVPSLGGALDIALLWRGAIQVGAVWRAVLSKAPVAGEFWPAELGVGLAVPLRGPGFNAALALDITGVGAHPSFAIGGEVGADWLLIRAGYGPAGIAFGGTVGWRSFALDWMVLLHPVLPAAFRVSFSVRI